VLLLLLEILQQPTARAARLCSLERPACSPSLPTTYQARPHRFASCALQTSVCFPALLLTSLLAMDDYPFASALQFTAPPEHSNLVDQLLSEQWRSAGEFAFSCSSMQLNSLARRPGPAVPEVMPAHGPKRGPATPITRPNGSDAGTQTWWSTYTTRRRSKAPWSPWA